MLRGRVNNRKGAYMGYKSKYFTAERYLRWLKRKENNNIYIDMISFNGIETINRIFKKHLNLGEYNTIWERSDWRKFLDSEKTAIDADFERWYAMTSFENDVIQSLFEFAKYVKPFRFGNKAYEGCELEIEAISSNPKEDIRELLSAVSVKYAIINQSEQPIEYEVVETYMITSQGKKLSKYDTIAQSDSGLNVLEYYTYCTYTDVFSTWDEHGFKEDWKFGIKVKDKTNGKIYHVRFYASLDPIWMREGWGSEEEWRECHTEIGNNKFEINEVVWHLEEIEVYEDQTIKPRDFLIKRISRSKKVEKELCISVKHVGCEVTEGFINTISVRGDIFPLKGECFKSNFEMICSVYDENDRIIRQCTKKINVMESLEYETFCFEFYGLAFEEVNRMKITYRRV